MSDEIVFIPADVCSHYINRIQELSDEISSVRRGLTESRQIVEINWSGESGSAAQDVIDKFNDKFREIDNSLSEIATLISGMSIVEE